MIIISLETLNTKVYERVIKQLSDAKLENIVIVDTDTYINNTCSDIFEKFLKDKKRYALLMYMSILNVYKEIQAKLEDKHKVAIIGKSIFSYYYTNSMLLKDKDLFEKDEYQIFKKFCNKNKHLFPTNIIYLWSEKIPKDMQELHKYYTKIMVNDYVIRKNHNIYVVCADSNDTILLESIKSIIINCS